MSTRVTRGLLLLAAVVMAAGVVLFLWAATGVYPHMTAFVLATIAVLSALERCA